MPDSYSTPRANSRDDIWYLSKMLMAEKSGVRAAHIAASIKVHGLMLMPLSAIWLLPLMWFVKWWRSFDDYTLWLKICESHSSISKHLIDDTIKHMRFGMDFEDMDSVGGFSQRETDILFEILFKE